MDSTGVQRERERALRHNWILTGGVGVVQVDPLDHARVTRHRVAHLGHMRGQGVGSKERVTGHAGETRRDEVEAVERTLNTCPYAPWPMMASLSYRSKPVRGAAVAADDEGGRVGMSHADGGCVLPPSGG